MEHLPVLFRDLGLVQGQRSWCQLKPEGPASIYSNIISPFLAERWNFIAMSGYCHMLSVVVVCDASVL